MYLNCYAKSSLTLKIEIFESMQFILLFSTIRTIKKNRFRVRRSLPAKNFVGHFNEMEFKMQ